MLRDTLLQGVLSLHYSDVAWTPCRFQSLSIRLSTVVQQLVVDNNNGNIEASCHWPFARGIHLWSVDPPHKRSVVQNILLGRDVLCRREALDLLRKYLLLSYIFIVSTLVFVYSSITSLNTLNDVCNANGSAWDDAWLGFITQMIHDRNSS